MKFRLTSKNYYYQSKTFNCWLQVNMNKVMIKILQGSAVTQTVLGGLPIHSLVANPIV